MGIYQEGAENRMLEGLTPPVKNAGSCKVETVSKTLSAEDRKILQESIDNHEWPIKRLARALADRGLQISDTPLGRHRQKACACYRVG